MVTELWVHDFLHRQGIGTALMNKAKEIARAQGRRAIILESPGFGLTWDIGHSKATGEKDVPFILENSEKLVHFHIHDGSENPPKNHLALKKSVEWLKRNAVG